MRNWLITGVSGGGLGQALARAALERGDRVYGTVRGAEAKAGFEALAPHRAIGLLLDLSDSASIAPLVAQVEKASGGIDILVNNSGYGLVGAIEETGLDQARAMFEVNVFGPAAVIQAALPAMRARRAGTIVNVTSMSGHAPWAGTAWYGASKFALECLGQTLADEVRPLGIRVMNAAPGGMRTSFAGRSLNKAEAHIADYTETAHNAERVLSAGAGQERGDPARAARAILAALDGETLPRHLFLGEDTHHHLTEAMDAVRADLEAFVPVHFA